MLPFYTRILICAIEVFIIAPISPAFLSTNATTFKVFLNQICRIRIMNVGYMYYFDIVTYNILEVQIVSVALYQFVR